MAKNFLTSFTLPITSEVEKNRPDIILLDLNMPKKDEREALEEIKSHSNFKNIPVIILTTSQAKIEIRKTYDLGANFIIQKSFKYVDFSSIMESFLSTRYTP
jgi:DNA-binding NarL/FixJ family response regulator